MGRWVSAGGAIAIFGAAFLNLASAHAEPVVGGQAHGPTASVADDDRTIAACVAHGGNLAPACIGVVADACLKTADSTQRIGECETRELRVWDAWLNRDYALVMARLPAAVAVKLRAVERNFVADTDRRCRFVETLNGPTNVNTPSEQECRLRATAIQWLWLRDFTSAG